MSIASEITRIRTAVADAYTSVSEKEGTLPAQQTVANLATAIDSISSGVKPTLTVYVDTGSAITVTKGSTTLTGTSVSGSCAFELPEFGTWSITATLSGESASDTVTFVGSQSKTLSYITYLPIGGRIFYIGADNGATYRFFDASYNEITTITVAGLANAVYYAITSGTPSADKFYVYDNTNGLATSKYWGWYGTQIGSSGVPPYRTDGIGYGKLNTQAVFTKGIPTDYTPNVWEYIQSINNANTGGCNDWFLGSEAEQDQLRSSGLVSWYSSNYIWSSVERSSTNAYNWYYSNSYWGSNAKLNAYCAVAFRAF